MDNIKKIIFVLLTLPLTGLSYANPSSRSNASSINSSKSASKDFHNLNQVNSASAVQPEVNADKVVLNFENADVQSVIKAISKLSGKNFVIDPRVKGTVNIVSDKPISKADSYKVLESALRMQGFAAVEADGVIKVLPENEAKTYGMQTEGSASLGKRRLGDQVVTKVFVIQHGSAMQLANSLRPLIAPNNAITVYPNSNALIVTDYASNIVRINKIISQLSDSGISIEPVVITLQNAIAADVARILQSYLTGGSGTSGGAAGVGQGEGPA
ncbi:MAG: secretin N-terminal domain-containing protein, partial [Burkholderiales bacterium]